eukprot:1140009-Prorocentrum_minimum.AAC.1
MPASNQSREGRGGIYHQPVAEVVASVVRLRVAVVGDAALLDVNVLISATNTTNKQNNKG